MPRRQQHPALPTMVLHVLQRPHHERYTAQPAADADQSRPSSVSALALPPSITQSLAPSPKLTPPPPHPIPSPPPTPPPPPLTKNKRFSVRKGKEKTYSVVFPLTYSVLVSARCRHAGQSTGAAPSPRFCSGVAVWYWLVCCCVCCCVWSGIPPCSWP